MGSLGHVLQAVGAKIMTFLRQESPPWLRELPPLRHLLSSLEAKWWSMQQVMAALETAHLLLADQDEYDIDAITFTITQDTIQAMQHDMASSTFIQHWHPQLAAPDTHDAIDVFRRLCVMKNATTLPHSAKLGQARHWSSTACH